MPPAHTMSWLRAIVGDGAYRGLAKVAARKRLALDIKALPRRPRAPTRSPRSGAGAGSHAATKAARPRLGPGSKSPRSAISRGRRSSDGMPRASRGRTSGAAERHDEPRPGPGPPRSDPCGLGGLSPDEDALLAEQINGPCVQSHGGTHRRGKRHYRGARTGQPFRCAGCSATAPVRGWSSVARHSRRRLWCPHTPLGRRIRQKDPGPAKERSRWRRRLPSRRARPHCCSRS